MVKGTRMECITQKLFDIIIKKSELFQADYYLTKSDKAFSFEEIPVFSKYEDVIKIEKYIKKKDVTPFFINVIVFIINNLRLSHNKKPFMAITFCNLDEDMKEVGYAIPNLFIMNEYPDYLTFEREIDIEKYPVVMKWLEELNLLNYFRFFETITKDDSDNIERLYMVPSGSPEAVEK
ncbi:hypothetical protein AGMMS50239_39040 [Bacteroidia bacterium]|nr:hypothetical protein AGMMS50239_39040 [Bacteroidia bacterium]